MYKLKYYLILISLGVFSFGTMCYITADQPNEQLTKITEKKSDNFTTLEIGKFRQLLSAKKGLLIDVRTPEETESGTIEGATHIDVYSNNFSSIINKLDKKLPFFLYGAIGTRSNKAITLMKEAGFIEVYNLKEGIRGWEIDGYPIEK